MCSCCRTLLYAHFLDTSNSCQKYAADKLVVLSTLICAKVQLLTQEMVGDFQKTENGQIPLKAAAEGDFVQTTNKMKTGDFIVYTWDSVGGLIVCNGRTNRCQNLPAPMDLSCSKRPMDMRYTMQKVVRYCEESYAQ